MVCLTVGQVDLADRPQSPASADLAGQRLRQAVHFLRVWQVEWQSVVDEKSRPRLVRHGLGIVRSVDLAGNILDRGKLWKRRCQEREQTVWVRGKQLETNVVPPCLDASTGTKHWCQMESPGTEHLDVEPRT